MSRLVRLLGRVHGLSRQCNFLFVHVSADREPEEFKTVQARKGINWWTILFQTAYVELV